MEDQKKEKKCSEAKRQSPVSNTTSLNLSAAHLIQNVPNPYNSNTIIKYFVPGTKDNASIEITSSTGQLIKIYPIMQKGKGQISVDAGSLTAGVYYFTLKLNGAIVDTKEMSLVK